MIGGRALPLWIAAAILVGAVSVHGLDTGAIDRLLEDARRDLGAFAVRLVHGGEVVYERVFGGFAIDQKLPIVSATKWLSAAVLQSLVDDGSLSLDDPVSAHYATLEVAGAPMTVRHLFTHTSGLPGDVPEGACTDRMSLAGCAEALAGLPVLTAPGRVFLYGEVSMQIGGAIAERVSGVGWNELFVERIARPLRMFDTDYLAYDASANPVIGGGARSTLRDYSRFVCMLLAGGILDGQRVLSVEAVAAILANQTPEMVYGPANGYGLGCWRERVDPTTGEALLVSSPGAHGFTPWIDLEHGIAGVIAVHGDGERVRSVFLQLIALLDGLFDTDEGAAVLPGEGLAGAAASPR